MHFTVEEFNPSKPRLILSGKEIELKVLDLKADGLFKEQFGSLTRIFDLITLEPLRLYEAAWILVDKKEIFNYSPKDFREWALQTPGESARLTIIAINECFAKSYPIIKNRAKYEAMIKLANETNPKPICYGVYYDKISKRYGYSIEQFYSLSLRQLHILLNVIGDQSYEDLEIQAALLGKKLKPRMEFNDLEEKQDKMLDDEAADTLKRLQDEYKARVENGK